MVVFVYRGPSFVGNRHVLRIPPYIDEEDRSGLNSIQRKPWTYGISSNETKSDASCTTEIGFGVVGHPCGEDGCDGVCAWDCEIERCVCDEFVGCAWIGWG
jgi:hypothetical protein